MFNSISVGNRRSGQAMPLSTNVKIPRGWKRLRDLKEKDIVITPAGKISEVVGVYLQGVTDVYRFHFEDGRYADSHPEHIWVVDELTYVNGERKISKDNLTTTQDIVTHFNEYQYQIPLVSKINGSHQASISDLDDLVNTLLRSSIPIGSSVLELPYRDRFFVTQKLLVKSGYQVAQGEVGFISTNETVCNNVQALLWSIGGIGIKTNSHGPGFRLNVLHPQIDILLPDAIGRVDVHIHRDLRLVITGVEKRAPEETACIKIDDPDHLFIVDNYIVTHNCN